jgi:hypothetical protein
MAGAWWLVGGDLIGTLGWDGALHSLFVGFVLSMVFGHVHMVAPAVLGISIRYRSWFSVHVAALHLSLVARVVGDIAGDPPMRRIGAIGNGVALVLFLVATASSARRRPEVPRHSQPEEKVTA